MRIVYHLGVHCTDEERLIKCLLKNRGKLAGEGIAVPGPARYRTLIRDTAASLDGRPASHDTQQMLLDQILEEREGVQRAILSWDNFLAFPPWALRRRFYPSAGERMHSMRLIFPDCTAEFHLAIRNPASFLPALLAKQRDRDADSFLAGVDPLDLFWSDMIGDIVKANPGVPVHVWCDEDTPLIWPEVLQSVAGHTERTVLDDTDDLVASLLSIGGMIRLRAHLKRYPPTSVAQRRAAVASFLDKLGRKDRMEMAVEMPGWTEDLIDVMSLQYDQDLGRIAALPGVTLTLP